MRLHPPFDDDDFDPVARMLGLAVLAVLVLAIVFALVWGGLVTR